MEGCGQIHALTALSREKVPIPTEQCARLASVLFLDDKEEIKKLLCLSGFKSRTVQRVAHLLHPLRYPDSHE